MVDETQVNTTEAERGDWTDSSSGSGERDISQQERENTLDEEVEQKIKLFKNYMKTKRLASDRTVQKYEYAVRKFYKMYGKLNEKNVDSFVKFCHDRRLIWMIFALKMYIRYLGKSSLLIRFPKTKNLPRKRRGVYIPDWQLEKIVDNVEPRWRLLAELQYLTGGRVVDLMKIMGTDIEIHDDYARINLTTKGGKERVVYIYDKRAIEKLEKFAGVDGYLFFKPMIKEESNYEEYRRALKEAAIKVLGEKGKEFSTHDMRRNFIRDVYIATGGDLIKTKNAVRHANISTTARYIPDFEEEVEGVIRKIRGSRDSTN